MALNKVVLFGRLTKEVEFTQVNQEWEVVKNSVAVARDYKNKNGEYETDFFDIEYWLKPTQRQYIQNNFHKGSRCLISGQLMTNKYQAQDGSNRIKTFIKVDNLGIIDFKNTEDKPSEVVYEGKTYKATSNVPDDMPF